LEFHSVTFAANGGGSNFFVDDVFILGPHNDCNFNGIPDECEPDCNTNGSPDECDIAGGTSFDCNTNGIPDDCDIAGGTSFDCNANGVPDECEGFPDCINDFCDGATQLCPGTVSGTTLDATTDGSASCGVSSNSPDKWYAYTPATDGQATFSTCGSWYDTVLSVHTGCPGTSANDIECNDDSCSDFDASVTLGVVAGQTYLLRVSGFNGEVGDFVLNLAGPDCAAEPEIPGDVDGDGTVGILDFLAVLGAWGPCAAPCPPTCAADCDNDCEVGINDFLIVLGDWTR
jgi:hypothetical protein